MDLIYGNYSSRNIVSVLLLEMFAGTMMVRK